MDEPQNYRRMLSKCPSFCVHKHTVLTPVLMPVKEKKCVGGVWVTCIILSVTSPSLPHYLFIYAKANLYSISGMAGVYILGITPTFHIPGAQLSLGLLVIPITVARSCTCPSGRQHPSTSLVPRLLASRKCIFYSREK